MKIQSITVGLVLFFVSLTASATVDSLARFKFIYTSLADTPVETYTYETYQQNLADGYSMLKSYCVGAGVFWDGISSSAFPIFKFMTQPYEVQVYGLSDVQTKYDINVLSHAQLQISFTYDDISNYVEQTNGSYVLYPSFVIDVSAFPRADKTQRFIALTYAKLAILGLFENLQDNFADSFSAEITVVGLPEQIDIIDADFSRVYSTTNYRYSSSSPIVAQYKEELISDYCTSF